MDWTNRHVLVTGASTGVGEALAREAARKGAKVGMVARREELLRKTAETIRAAGGKAEYTRADVADRASLKAAFAELAAKLGPVEVLLANAGVGSTNTAQDLKMEEAETVIRVNLLGVMYAIGEVLPGMIERKRGQIAAISSLSAYKGLPGAAAYVASKAAVNNYMESLRIQARKTGVKFTTACPGFIRTPMTEKNKGMFLVLESDAAARRIVRAVQAERKVYNFPWGTTFTVKCSRWLPDWLVGWLANEEIGGQGAEKKS